MPDKQERKKVFYVEEMVSTCSFKLLGQRKSLYSHGYWFFRHQRNRNGSYVDDFLAKFKHHIQINVIFLSISILTVYTHVQRSCREGNWNDTSQGIIEPCCSEWSPIVVVRKDQQHPVVCGLQTAQWWDMGCWDMDRCLPNATSGWYNGPGRTSQIHIYLISGKGILAGASSHKELSQACFHHTKRFVLILCDAVCKGLVLILGAGDIQKDDRPWNQRYKSICLCLLGRLYHI